jgi:hypothetical protein
LVSHQDKLGPTSHDIALRTYQHDLWFQRGKSEGWKDTCSLITWQILYNGFHEILQLDNDGFLKAKII